MWCSSMSERDMPSALAASSSASSRAVSDVAASRAAASRSASATVVTRPTLLAQRREALGLVLGDQRVDKLAEAGPFEHLVELVQRQPDAVVGHSALREIV